MLLVGGFMLHSAFTTRYYAPPRARWGPSAVFTFAALLIMVEPSRHVLTDKNIWPWCGNNPVYGRINATSGWGDACAWSATQYVCTQPCCVSTWQPTSAAPTANFAWSPPSADFYPAGPLPGPFGTIRTDGSIYYPPGFFEIATQPYSIYNGSSGSPPLTFYETGALNPLTHRVANLQRTDCIASYHPPTNGVNPETGYCYLTNQSLSYEEQLEQLPLADSTRPFNASTNPHVCACDACVPQENIFHLSVVGVISTLLCTYLGFALLAVAVGWNANIMVKLKKIPEQWRQLRGTAARARVSVRDTQECAAVQPLPTAAASQ